MSESPGVDSECAGKSEENDSFRREWAKVADLEVEACEDKVKVSGVWGEAVFGTWGETVEEAIENLKQVAGSHDDPRPDADGNVYRTTDDETFNRCLHCNQLPSADHHELIGTNVVKCRWDDVNDFDVFAERDGRVVECPECGGRVREKRVSDSAGAVTVECRECGGEFFRESFDFGSFPAGQQKLRDSDGEVVARVQ